MVGVSLGPLVGWMIYTVEVPLVGLSLVLPLVYPLDSPNTALTGIILFMTLGNPLVFMLDSIWHINCCGPNIGTCQFL